LTLLETQASLLREQLFRARWRIKQSNVLVVSEKEVGLKLALRSLSRHRRQLEEYIRHDPRFVPSLYPIKLSDDAPLVARLAADAASLVDVGPMAAVPGALADLMLEEMNICGPRVRLVENGGEIAASASIPLKVGLYAGRSPLSGKIGFTLSEADYPIGISTSSATVSHALSFGEADAAVVFSDSAAVADAAATSVCNAVTGKDIEASVQAGLEAAEKIDQVRGALIIRGLIVGRTGKLPQLMSINGDLSDMFRAAKMIL
jgi:ApbE superfamily uncharacterized protein (UPF0280 family)